MKPLFLASSSPRRKEILELAGLSFRVLVPSCKEEGVVFTAPDQYAEALSGIKCAAGTALAKSSFQKGLVIGADTIVYHKNRILGKPSDEQDAFRMLRELSGDTHWVYTGVTVTDLESGRSETFHEKTEVLFYELTDEEIQAYIQTKEPMDKAGAYGIQGRGSCLVKEIHGDFFNVVGLPIARLVRVFKHYE